MHHSENERPFFVNKDILDTINSISWFFMDAFWMLQMKQFSFAFIFPTVLTGIFLCYIEKRLSVSFINFAIMCWICMNVSWMFSDMLGLTYYLTVAKACLALGLCFILASVISSKNVSETFSHFRRFRLMKKK